MAKRSATNYGKGTAKTAAPAVTPTTDTVVFKSDIVATETSEAAEESVSSPSADEQGHGSGESQVQSSVPAVDPLTKILTEEQALALLKRDGYDKLVRDTDTCIFVTEDTNVFLQANESSAYSHARTHKLKLHRITWD
jgi:hypothetical protein